MKTNSCDLSFNWLVFVYKELDEESHISLRSTEWQSIMRWLFSKSSGSQRALVENKLKIKKKPLLWSLFCTRKRSSVTSARPLRENLDNNKSKCVRQRRRSKICSKLDATRLSSYESLSNILNNSEDGSKCEDPLYDSPQECCNALPTAFCPTCHTNVIPVFEKDNYSSPNTASNDMKNQRADVSNEYAIYAVYESVYKNSLLSLDTNMEYGFVECAEDYAFNGHEAPMYLSPTEPLAFSTIDRRAINMDDCETIYDEVASDDEEEPVNSFSGYYITQNPLVMLKQNNKPFRKRGANPDSDSYQEMKRIRREVFVCEE
ncbi:unnamed protein product [Trichobilharzia szidati]|nr:unnamed protein product [Trichobilharzia szidati]